MAFAKLATKHRKMNKEEFEEIRFSGEVAMVKILEEDFALSNYYDIFDQEEGVLQATNTMLTNAVKLNHLLAPRLYTICTEIGKFLHFEEEIDFYLVSSPEVNAFSLNGFGFESHIICLTSSLVNMVTDEELRYVIGHEIGHLIYGHSKLDVVQRLINNREDNDISNALSYNLVRWHKYAEISSDRIGYLVCPHPKVIGNLFFKFASGLSEDTLNFDVEEYLKQLDKVKELAVGDFYATHPNNMVRIKSLLLFGESEFLKEEGSAKKTIAADELDQKVSEYLDILELHPHKKIDKKILEFYATVCVYVALTSEGISEAKTYLLNEILGAYTSQPEKYLYFDSKEELQTRIDKVCKYFSNRHDTYKYTLMEKLIYFIISDGRMEKHEKEMIFEIGKKLRISEYEITQSIRRMSENFLMPQKRITPGNNKKLF